MAKGSENDANGSLDDPKLLLDDPNDDVEEVKGSEKALAF